VILASAICSWDVSDEMTQPPSSSGDNYFPPAGDGVPDPCDYWQVAPQPGPDDPAWGANDPEHGRLWVRLCPREFEDGTIHMVFNGNPYYVPDGETPDGPAAQIDPMTLVERARGAITLPAPEPSFGPDAATLAVKVPVWLSVAPFAPITETATAGRLTATVTAELTDTTWQMGEPLDPAQPQAMAPPVVCAGAGSPFTAGANPGEPPCGYTYRWRSLAERTGGAGTWPATVTSRYTITWTITDGGGATVDANTDTVETTATTPLLVREWHSILVDQLPS
jgi:hypothetical protein